MIVLCGRKRFDDFKVFRDQRCTFSGHTICEDHLHGYGFFLAAVWNNVNAVMRSSNTIHDRSFPTRLVIAFAERAKALDSLRCTCFRNLDSQRVVRQRTNAARKCMYPSIRINSPDRFCIAQSEGHVVGQNPGDGLHKPKEPPSSFQEPSPAKAFVSTVNITRNTVNISRKHSVAALCVHLLRLFVLEAFLTYMLHPRHYKPPLFGRLLIFDALPFVNCAVATVIQVFVHVFLWSSANKHRPSSCHVPNLCVALVYHGNASWL